MPRKLPPAPPGFPWNGKFKEVSELKKYFAQDKLQCLLCGREYGNLGLHITRGHNISHDDYKVRFGIPWTYGLAGQDFKTTNSKRLKKLRKQGKIPQSPSKQHLKRLHAARSKSRQIVEAFRNDSRRKILEQHGRTEKWQPQDYEEFLKRIAKGRTPHEVSQDKDMPGVHAFNKYAKDNSAFMKRYQKIWDDIPYAVQARAGRLNERFYKEVVRLRRLDLSWPEIAEKLDVTKDAARGAWHILKAKGKLKKNDQAHEYKRYTRQDYDEYLRRVSTGRRVTHVGRDADMPQADLFYIYLRKNPDFKRKFQRMWEDLPYNVQAQSRRMGQRFKREVKSLRRQGLSSEVIGKRLGVSGSLVRAHY